MEHNFKDRKILITGATGLIGKALVNRLLSMDAYVYAVTRNAAKAKEIWGEPARLTVIEADVTGLPLMDLGIDYIVHGAACTSSRAFVDEPVDVMMTNISGTSRLLEFAKLNTVSGFVYLSTMEVYGTPSTDEKITELHETNINTMTARSSYAESKRACESLCTAYVSQYNVPAKVLRLTQTFGPGVKYDDGRVFAEFARCVIEGRDIVLHTKGETKRNYLFTEDAVDAILTVLKKGEAGEAYNAANEDTYCSVYDMAKLVAAECGNGQTEVLIEEYSPEEVKNRGFAPVLCMNLDTAKLRSLGWTPTAGLKEMYRLLIEDMKKGKK